MKIKGNTTWKPMARRPMLTNRLAGPQLGQWQPVLITAARWLIPWLAVSAGVALTSNVAKNALPEVPINKKNIALSSALMGAGATSYFVSEGLDEKYKPWAYAAAVAGIASGLYFLFQEPSTAKEPMIPSRRVTATEGLVPNYNPAQMQEAFTMFVDPNQVNTGGQRRWPDDQEYEVIVKNDTNQPQTFFVGLELYGNGSQVLFRSPEPKDLAYGRKRVSLQPTGRAGSDAPVRLTVPYRYNGEVIPPMYEGLALDFQLFRQGDDSYAFKTSESIPISYGFVPIG